MDWETIVKVNPLGKGAFTEQMKQSVLAQAEQTQRRKGKRSLFYMTALLTIIACMLILPRVDGSPEVIRQMSLVLERATLSSNASSMDDIVLHYEPAADLTVIPDTDKGIRSVHLLKLPLASVRINEEVSVGGVGRYIDYTKSGNDSVSYFGFELTNDSNSKSGEFYEIGYGKMTNVNFQKSDAFGLSDYRLNGTCGPERRCVYWIHAKKDNVVAYEQLDASSIYEQDLDGDKVKEAIVLTHDGNMYIYKNMNGQIQFVSLHAALRATEGDKVTYSPEHQEFQLHSRGQVERFHYAVGVDLLHPLRD
ncbi:hypothetical protein [Paenibacillus hexagrammi]|uniref:DUF4179 domain-containing protein n=1 Tax=Paenibacillus hexagrammi TaxID=2908839 RepID=A0ABY3SG62_9BACL|nr:hypothetical protein [Paenibacillus sp. YPD9-1]UJF33023.1 hypothetical protein L0M14_26205 [Paenibacillus sp. YPD9-1]